MNKKMAARYFIRELLGLFVMGSALFLSAGTLNWWPAWAALGVMLAWILATAFVVFVLQPDLLAERLGPRKGAPAWDTILLSILGMLQLLRYCIAGLDHRYGWTHAFPWEALLLALLVCILGYALLVWATTVNPFFSQVTRIQAERGHTTVMSGPYQRVRHPAYLGAIAYEFAIPFLLASGWALLVSAACIFLLILRTSWEDSFLQKELSGYAEFSKKVRYRLIPGIW
jgi:protein-S-isoprenylcysteine O-methyltransferase Ste14